MRQDRMLTIAAVFWLVIGFITVLSGHVIFGGILMLLGFGIFYLRGRGSYNDRSLYTKQIKANIEIKELYEKLKSRGILVRYFGSDRISNFVRITIGTKEQMEALVNAVSEILKGE
jgi:hypothetical protein